MNRYNAATGRYIHMPEPEESRAGSTASVQPPAAAEPPTTPARRTEGAPRRSAPAAGPRRNAPAAGPGRSESPLAGLNRLLGGLGGGVSRRMGSLETEDLLLLAVIYLMYRESGDNQLLIVLAALLFS